MEPTESLCQRQHLARPHRGRCEEIVRDLVGLQAQSPEVPALSLWTRRARFRPELLERAMLRERTLVKTWAMRGTLHVLRTEDLALILPTIKAATLARMREHMVKLGYDPAGRTHARLRERLLRIFAQPTERSLAGERAGISDTRLLWLLCAELSAMGRLLHVDMRAGKSILADRREWIGEVGTVPAREALGRLLVRYLRGYAPATMRDFAHWSGLKAALVRAARAAAGDQVRAEGDDLFPAQETRRRSVSRLPVRLLPRFDPFLLGHREKSHYLDARFRQRVYRPVAEVAAVILIDGRVGGTWRQVKRATFLDIDLHPFHPIARSDRTAVEALALDVAAQRGLAIGRVSWRQP